ncbi:uncharacterized protein DNG_03609 [Cephalotrichum gorgonifer]|uniref:Uncharacterized protein n=1 Tax=Cephalotrichum gorgonifer TaxID=2041049 RepID=A0AAE8MWX7_9PEZI|nr:uncharacterized protein DNG_03609 [Cephalotrichum gorgonifer]
MSRPSVQGTRHLCRHTLASPIPTQTLRPLAIHSATPATRQLRRRLCQQVVRRNYATASVSTPPSIPTAPADSDSSATQRRALPDLTKLVSVVDQTRNRFLSAGGIPSSQLALVALKTCQTAASTLKPHLNRRDFRPPSNASSDLLALGSNGSKASAKAIQKEQSLIKDTADNISQAAYDIVASPNVVITPEILELYVDVQSQLSRPSTIPDVFELFATKPLPKKAGADGSVTYKERFRNRPDAAIELDVADKALKAAMAAKDLDAAIGIVEACYTGKPFLIQKLLRTAAVPGMLAVAAPFVIYTLAHQFAAAHFNVDPVMATKITFAGGMTYLIFTGSLGLISKATTADQMVRVTWAPGVPLRDRWIREEERAALDKVALAWGFKETWRHGEEAGSEWACLREYIGQKGMILDRIEFMEGMN